MVVMVDEVQVEYYDSNTQRIIPKQDWADRANREDPDSLERDTENRKGIQQVFKASMGILKRRFNQTGAGLIPLTTCGPSRLPKLFIQRMSGCEWEMMDGYTEGMAHGYDGEGLHMLDLKDHAMGRLQCIRLSAPTQMGSGYSLGNQYVEELLHQGVCDEPKKAPGLGEEHSAEERVLFP
ncbi:unnamed protein product [Arctogadus glacialis]